MHPDDVRPDPTRGREVLDAIDRFKARRRQASNVVPIRSAPVTAPIKFASEPWSLVGETCAFCGNVLSGTKHPPAQTKDGPMHPKCEKRWFKTPIPLREIRRADRALDGRPLAGRQSA